MKRIIIYLLFIVFFASCNSDDDCHEVIINTVSITIQINDLNGINLFDNQNFDISLLKILSATDTTIELDFFVVEEQLLIEYSGDVIFNYEGEDIADLKLINTESETNRCGAITSFSFTAQSNGQIICECNQEDTIFIPFDI